jgi:hypothetical protein
MDSWIPAMEFFLQDERKSFRNNEGQPGREHSVTSVTILFILKFAVYSSLQYFTNPYLITFLAPVVGFGLCYLLLTFSICQKRGDRKFFKDMARPSYFYITQLFCLLLHTLLLEALIPFWNFDIFFCWSFYCC